jgi:hypothetical protein
MNLWFLLAELLFWDKLECRHCATKKIVLAF